jgi:phage-related protein
MALISVSIVGNAAPLKKSVEETDGLMARLGSSFTKIGAVAAAGFGAVAAGIGFAAKAAADDQKSFEQLRVTLQNTTGATDAMVKSVDEQIGKMSLATGIADDKLRPAFEALARGTKDIDASMENMNLVLDISTALQVDATSVADALAKGFQGNTKALKSLSPEMAALIKDGADMNDVIGVLSETYAGSATAAANTFSGQITRLKVFMSELVEQIGYYVLPVLSKIAEFIVNEVVPSFQQIIENYGPKLAAIFQTIADFIAEQVVPILRDQLIPFIQQVAEFISERLVPVIRDVAIKVFEGLRTVFVRVSEKIDDNRDKIENIIDFFRELTEFVQQYVAPVLVKVLGKAFEIVAKAIGPVIDVVFSLMDAFASLGSFILKVAGFLVNTFESAVNGVIEVVNFAIRQQNRINPFRQIDEIGKVSIGGAFGKAPAAPAKPVKTPTIPPGITDSFQRTTAPTGVPTFTPGIDEGLDEEDKEEGGGGGGKGRTVRVAPVDMTGQVRIIGGTSFGGGGGGGTGAVLDTAAVLDGMPGGTGVVNITVNTVSADANLPNLIVDALQQYNLVNGPIDVTIAA